MKKCTKLCVSRGIILNDLNIAPFLMTGTLEKRMARNAVSLTSIFLTHVLRTVTSCILAITSGTSSFRYQYIVYNLIVLFSVEASIEAMSVADTRMIFLQSLQDVFYLGAASNLQHFSVNTMGVPEIV